MKVFLFHRIAAVVIVLFCMLVWWPTRNLPYHWDSAGFFINATKQLVDTGFSPWVAEFSDFAHPPLLMTLVGGAWNVFGEELWVSHVVMWVFLPLLMGATYLIGRKVLAVDVKKNNDSYLLPEIEALGGALLVGAMPFVLVEYGLVYIDLPAGALFSVALAAVLYRRYGWMAAFMVAAGMVKESVLIGLPILGFVMASHIWKDEGVSWSNWQTLTAKKYWKRWILLALPVVVFGIWLVYHFQVTGWWLVRPERQLRGVNSLGDMFVAFKFVTRELLFTQGRVVFSLGGLVGLGMIMLDAKKRTLLWSYSVMALWLLVILGVAAFAKTGEFGLRYGIFLVPAVVIFLVRMNRELVMLFTKKYVRWGMVGIISLNLLLFISAWHPVSGQLHAEYRFAPVTDLGYRDMISVASQAAEYLEINYPDATIYGGFPENYQLSEPYQGYVDEPLNFRDCKDYVYSEDEQAILYIHPYSPSQIPCSQILLQVQTRPLEKHQFVSNDTWVELYEIVGLVVEATGEAEFQ